MNAIEFFIEQYKYVRYLVDEMVVGPLTDIPGEQNESVVVVVRPLAHGRASAGRSRLRKAFEGTPLGL